MLKIEKISKTFNPGTIHEKAALQGLSLHLLPGFRHRHRLQRRRQIHPP